MYCKKFLKFICYITIDVLSHKDAWIECLSVLYNPQTDVIVIKAVKQREISMSDVISIMWKSSGNGYYFRKGQWWMANFFSKHQHKYFPPTDKFVKELPAQLLKYRHLCDSDNPGQNKWH